MSGAGSSVRLDGRAVAVTGAGRGIAEARAAYAGSLSAAVVVDDVNDRAERAAAIADPVLHRESWSADDVASAFEDVLARRQSPTGLAWVPGPPTSTDPGHVGT